MAPLLKRHVCKTESLERGTLHLSLSEKKPLDDSARLALRGNAGPGSSEVDLNLNTMSVDRRIRK